MVAILADSELVFLAISSDKFIIFDAREKAEFDVSHIPDAIYLGYSDFNVVRIKNIPKEKNIVIYCSIGYRSEKIGEKLLRLGYKNVYNLYGSIFEWANEKYPLLSSNGKTTYTVHSYNKSWSKWVTNEEIRTVW